MVNECCAVSSKNFSILEYETMHEKINGNKTVNTPTEDLQTLDNDRTLEGLRKRLPNPSAQQWASYLDFSTSYEVPIESGDEEEIRASEEQAERFENDVWQDTVNQWLENTYRSRVTGLDIMEECLELPRGQQGVVTGRRISQIMAQAGWKRDDIRPAQKDRDGKTRRVFEWINPRGEYLKK